MYRCSFQPKFRQTDATGNVYFSEMLNISHDIFEGFISSEITSWEEFFGRQTYSRAIRHLEVDYHAPLKAGQVYTCELAVKNIKTTSFETQLLFFDNSHERCTTIQLVHVLLEKDRMKKLPLPRLLKEKLSGHLLKT